MPVAAGTVGRTAQPEAIRSSSLRATHTCGKPHIQAAKRALVLRVAMRLPGHWCRDVPI
jgi:hypothetical protein